MLNTLYLKQYSKKIDYKKQIKHSFYDIFDKDKQRLMLEMRKILLQTILLHVK